MNEPIPPGRERPIAIRGAFLVMGFVVAGTTLQKWSTTTGPDGEHPPLSLLIVPLLLSGSMALQYFAKRKDSPLLIVSLGLIGLSLVGLFGATRGWFG